jgi:hypothetical protein
LDAIGVHYGVEGRGEAPPTRPHRHNSKDTRTFVTCVIKTGSSDTPDVPGRFCALVVLSFVTYIIIYDR